MIDQKIIKILSNKLNLYILRFLRNIPLKHSDLINAVKKFEKFDEKSFEKSIKALKSEGFITEFSFNDNKYYLLIKDFYILKIPPVNIIKLLQYSKILSKNIQSKCLAEIKKYNLILKKTKDIFNPKKEYNLLTIISNAQTRKYLEILRNGPIPQKKLKKLVENFNKFKDIMLKNDFILIINDSGESWFVLKFDIKFEIFFPEYLIDNINKALNEGRVSKDFALKALSVLKWNYLKNEMPNKFKELKERIENKKKIIEFAERKGTNPKEHVKSLIKLLKEIGDYDSMKYWKEKYLD
ncbi:MAG: hypothetical protein ACP6IY_00905 [Promethearchaeia archaeon]